MRSLNSNGTLNAFMIQGNEIVTEDRYGYKVVAVVSFKFWAAYKGFTDWSDEKVASEGDKLDRKTAALLFPTLDKNLRYND